MEKLYVSAEELLRASYELAWQVYESGFRPDYIIGIWRGGAPVGIAIQEFFDLMGVFSDHIAIRTSSYSGIGQQNKEVKVYGLNYMIEKLKAEDSLLIVDDVYDTGLSIQQIITDLKKEIVVSYEGLVPNLFAEGKGVVAEGKLKDRKYFIAAKILAKHDENYMPPEVSKALENSNN